MVEIPIGVIMTTRVVSTWLKIVGVTTSCYLLYQLIAPHVHMAVTWCHSLGVITLFGLPRLWIHNPKSIISLIHILLPFVPTAPYVHIAVISCHGQNTNWSHKAIWSHGSQGCENMTPKVLESLKPLHILLPVGPIALPLPHGCWGLLGGGPCNHHPFVHPQSMGVANESEGSSLHYKETENGMIVKI